MSIIEAIILAIIEGLTEYLPVSSTGHMIIGSSIMGIQNDDFTKLFTVAIQLGAILSVLVLYFKRFFKSINFYVKLIIAFIPAVIFGLLLSDFIDSLLESPLTVGISLFIGGILLLYVDRWFNKPVMKEEEDIDYLTALKVGFFQCLAMIPGVSRSGASIVGGMSQKMSRTVAAEFSFFLAVPTMFAATAKKLWDYFDDGHTLNIDQWKTLAIGNIVAFVIALIAIKSFIGYLNKNGFKLFGYYRIIIGLIIILLYVFGVKLEIV